MAEGRPGGPTFLDAERGHFVVFKDPLQSYIEPYLREHPDIFLPEDGVIETVPLGSFHHLFDPDIPIRHVREGKEDLPPRIAVGRVVYLAAPATPVDSAVELQDFIKRSVKSMPFQTGDHVINWGWWSLPVDVEWELGHGVLYLDQRVAGLERTLSRSFEVPIDVRFSESRGLWLERLWEWHELRDTSQKEKSSLVLQYRIVISAYPQFAQFLADLANGRVKSVKAPDGQYVARFEEGIRHDLLEGLKQGTWPAEDDIEYREPAQEAI